MRFPQYRYHYGWVIAFSGLLTVIATLGLGRFSLGMLLPSMGADLKLSYSQMGWVGTGNFTGYLLAVLCCPPLLRKFSFRSVISAGIILCGLSLVMMSFTLGFWTVLAALFCAGFGSGLGNVPVMVLASRWFASSMRGLASGIMVSGSGLGIMLSGVLVPSVNDALGVGQGWRVCWMVLGGLVFIIGSCCALLIRNTPAEKGHVPLGDPDGSSSTQPQQEKKQLPAATVLLRLASLYFIFGFTYVIYLTFVVTTLIDEYHFSERVAGQFWLWFGCIGIFSGPLFGTISDRLGRANTLMAVYLLMAISHLLLALGGGSWSLYLSIGLFALCAWSVPSIVAAAVGDFIVAEKAAAGFSMVTLVFGIGQLTGPAIAGVLAEVYGGFAPAYLMAAGIVFGGAILSLSIPRR
jgi:MFS family permease